jgi:signal transduction histidine kinase
MVSSNASAPALQNLTPGTEMRTWARLSDTLGVVVRRAHSIITRPFARPAGKLTSSQRIDLERDLLDALRKRVPYWIATVIAASLFVLWYGMPAAAHPPGPVGLWFGPGAITKPLWGAVLWLLLCPYLALAQRTAALPADVTLRSVREVHIAWSLWITIVMLWWLCGYWTLMPSPEPIRVFEFGQRPFVFFALILHASAITVLATSRTSITLGIACGYILPFTLLIGPSWHLPFSYIQVIALATIFMILGWLIGSDQRRLRARSILIEAERERANRFIASISHDLRQPITTLRMRLRTMSSRAPQEMLSDIYVLDSQTEAIITMVEATLDLARLEAGTWRLEPRETPLPFILDRIQIEQFGETADNVQFAVQTEPFIVRTDPAALDRIVRNLVANAIRYARKQTDGTPSFVRISCEVDGPVLRINVTDNGLGIPASKLDDIFAEYVQLANPERDRTKGFGLGLSIVKGLADRLGHKISVTSVLGEGSTFSIEVPNLGRIPPELMLTGEWDGQAPDLTGMVVAIVEDDAGPRGELRTLLIEWGAYVVDGESSDEVVTKLQDNLLPAPPHFIICDYRLRHYRTGTAAVHEIRAAIGVQTPAAIWTAETSPSVLREIAANGFSHFAKPPDEKALLALLSAHRPEPELV